MKEAQDLRAGNTVKINNELFLITHYDYHKSGRNDSVVKYKLKNLRTGAPSDAIYRASDKLDQIVLDKRPMQYLYKSNDTYVFMEQENYEQIEMTVDDLGDATYFLKEEMEIEVQMYDSKPVGVELPINVELKITFTEPGNKGDSSGRVLKPAKLETGYEVQVPLFCNEGDIIRIDTRTGEYAKRV